MRQILAAPAAQPSSAPSGIKQGRPRLSKATRVGIAKQYADGKSSLALATEYGIGKATVLTILREHSVVVRRKPPLTHEQVAEAADAYADGQSLAQIAKPLGVSPNTVRNAFLGAGIKTRPRIGR